MKLPYVKETTFTLNGKTHNTETSAITAAVQAVVGNPGLAATVVGAACELAPLLTRACELGMDKPQDPRKADTT